MKKISKFLYLLLLAVSAMSLTSCGEDDLGPTIFPDTDTTLDPSSSTYKFDKWLKENFLDVYNLQFEYKFVDVENNMNYNLIPADYDKSVDLAVLTKYLWFDAYAEVTGSQEFIKTNGPRIISLIGSAAYNATSGSMILGLAEGGIRVSLFRVNSMQSNNIEQLNEYYFKTMHHEFAHILHQTKSIPSTFQTLSTGHYDANNWQDRQESMVNSLGYVTSYASSEVREDFAETIANYITKSDEDWANILKNAARGWTTDPNALEEDGTYYCYYYYVNNTSGEDNIRYISENSVVTTTDASGNTVYYYGNERDTSGNRILVYEVSDNDGVDGVAIINQKLELARGWFRDQWNIDLDKIREVVQRRQSDFDITTLRQQVYNQ